MKTCIIIPIKTINKRLPGKNTKLLDGKPLYEYLFSTLKNIPSNIIDEVYIDSSDIEILQIANDWNFKLLKRPVKYNSDNIAGNDLINRVIDVLNYDIIGQLHVTSPFIRESTIKKSIKLLKENNIDSVFGVKEYYNRFWFRGVPINHNNSELMRTQDLEPICEEADFYFFKKSSFKQYGMRICGNFKIIKITDYEGVDIDTYDDFMLAECLLKNNLVQCK